MRAVLGAARGGLTRLRVQAVVIGFVVLIATAATSLALGLLVDANKPFDHAFAAQRGAHVTATVAAGDRPGRVPGATAAAGPFAQATADLRVSLPGIAGVFAVPSATLAGRASPGGPVDDITLDSGRWVRRAGEIVVSRDLPGPTPQVGQQLTAAGRTLTVVGIGKSITDSADGWVVPGQIGALRTPGSQPTAELLYRFADAGTQPALTLDEAAIRAVLPPGSVLGTASYLSVKVQAMSSIAPWVPFIVAFGVLALVLSVLIVINVVGGAVAAGTRRIGVLKSVGFTPAQVVAVYLTLVLVPALAGCVAGVACGNLLSAPLLGQTADVFGVGRLLVPFWVDLAVPAAMMVLVAVAALVPAARAGRFSVVQAIATGRSPRAAHGYLAHRLLSRVRWLPRPVTIGLARPFARLSRSLVTLAAILLGGTAVIFAAGLATSLNRAEVDLSHSASEPVQLALHDGFGQFTKAGAPPPASPPSLAAQQRAVEAALRLAPGTAHYVAEADDDVPVTALSGQLSLTAFRGDASWTGYALIGGHWYAHVGEAVVNTSFLTATGTSVGSTLTLDSAGRRVTVRIVGEVFAPDNGRSDLLASLATLARLDPRLATPQQYQVMLKPGTDPRAYAGALGQALGSGYDIGLAGGDAQYTALIGLVVALTLLIMSAAGLGVLNTVVLSIRERVHELGVFKAVGMTPGQTISVVLSSVAGIGVLAGLIAVPAGIALHGYVIPVMGRAGQTSVPASLISVYHVWELALLALSGLVIALVGALLPAGWAARSGTAVALRAE